MNAELAGAQDRISTLELENKELLQEKLDLHASVASFRALNEKLGADLAEFKAASHVGNQDRGEPSRRDRAAHCEPGLNCNSSMFVELHLFVWCRDARGTWRNRHFTVASSDLQEDKKTKHAAQGRQARGMRSF